MQLRFPEAQIATLSRRYSYTRGEQDLIDLRETVQRAGFITKEQLQIVALWKSPRSAGHVNDNDSQFVREISGFALSATNERSRIELLTILNGVQWPMASVILHFFHSKPYPILDFRALWSVGLSVPAAYTFEFWWPYVEFCRSLATRNRVDMRTLDQALWQYSKENQSSGKSSTAEDTSHEKPGNTRTPVASTAVHAKVPAMANDRTKRSSNKLHVAGSAEGTVFWVSCVSQKQSIPAAAKDLYISALFSKARAYVEQTGAPWFILSAKYGLVAPDEIIAPYDLTLNTMGVADRRAWAKHVIDQLTAQSSKPRRIVMLAGDRYREFVTPGLQALGIDVDVPMQGLRIGEQLSWLSTHAAPALKSSMMPKSLQALHVGEGPTPASPMVSHSRLEDLKHFYQLLDRLKDKLGGQRILANCDGRMGWPERGIYFFFEPGEIRSDSGTGMRVVRVGTHAVTASSKTSLWNRLSNHRGTLSSGGGNHRGSIFRLIVGSAIKRRDRMADPVSWGIGNDTSIAASKLGIEKAQIQPSEEPLEQAVTAHIGQMPFLWLNVDDSPGPDSLRGFIERNSIALLSNYAKDALDPPTANWLGKHSDRERVIRSGLWNNNHVDEDYDPSFLATLEQLIDATTRST